MRNKYLADPCHIELIPNIYRQLRTCKVIQNFEKTLKTLLFYQNIDLRLGLAIMNEINAHLFLNCKTFTLK